MFIYGKKVGTFNGPNGKRVFSGPYRKILNRINNEKEDMNIVFLR